MNVLPNSKIRTLRQQVEADILFALGEGDARGETLADLGKAHGHDSSATLQALNKLHRDKLIGISGANWYRLTNDGALALLFLLDRLPKRLRKEIQPPFSWGLTPTNGHLEVGLQAAGAWHYWTLFDDRGAHNVLVAGSSGSGTTNALRVLLQATAKSDLVRVWAADPAFDIDRAGEFGIDRLERDNDGIEVLIDDVLQVIERRHQVLAENGDARWTGPTRGMPLGILMLTGAAQIFERHPDWMHRILRAGRKVGVMVAAEVGDLTLRTFQNVPIRDSFLADNVLILRMVSEASIPTIKMLPEGLPPIPRWINNLYVPSSGIGYDQDGTLLRSIYVP